MNNQADNEDFKKGLKATSLFGGVQVFNILIGIVRSKLVAVLLGPEGMGFNGILNSTLQLINSATGLGLGTSAVKNVSEAHAKGDKAKLTHTISILRVLVWLTGIAGFLLCLFFSPILSKVSFGSFDYILAFAAVSITVLFMQLTEGQRVLLQGTRHFKYMAKASVLGSLIGLFTTIPLYYFFGMKGVVPAIIIASLTALCLMWHFSNKAFQGKEKVPLKMAISEGREMIKMGFFLSLQGLLSLFMAYLIRVFINRTGGMAEVGLFVAGFALVDTYMGLVFNAMSTEYYPRLASRSSGDSSEFGSIINHQIEISLILISPLICAFIIFGNFAVTILYSQDFSPITTMLCLAVLGTFFKAPSWCMAYSFLAKSDATLFFYNELTASLYGAVLKIVFYYFWGLTGIGVAYALGYLLYLLQVWAVCKRKYSFSLDFTLLRIFSVQLFLGVGCFLLFLLTKPIIRYFSGSVLILVSFIISYKLLSLRIDIKSAILKFKNR